MKRLIAVFALVMGLSTYASAVTINIWHGYRGDEKTALEEVAASFNLAYSDVTVKYLSVPFDALNDKLRATIPLNNGPDVFVFAQDYVGAWAENGLILPLEYYLDDDTTDLYFSKVLGAFNYMYPEAIWALPGSFKNIALFYNKDLVDDPPDTMSELLELAQEYTDESYGQFGKWGFVYETGNFYQHTMWVQGFGGKIFTQIGETSAGSPIFLPLLYSQPMVDAGDYVYDNIVNGGVCPSGPSGTLVTQLFNAGTAMFVVNGQWFRGEIDDRIDYGVAKLPIIDEVGNRAIPFLTAEGYFMSSCCVDQEAAVKVIKYFTSAAMGKVFAEVGKQTPANKGAYDYSVVYNDDISAVFKSAAATAISMPNVPAMALTWDPATSSMNEILGGTDPATALKTYQQNLMDSIEEDGGFSYSDYGYYGPASDGLYDVD